MSNRNRRPKPHPFVELKDRVRELEALAEAAVHDRRVRDAIMERASLGCGALHAIPKTTIPHRIARAIGAGAGWAFRVLTTAIGVGIGLWLAVGLLSL